MVAPLYGTIPLERLISRSFGCDSSATGLVVFAFGIAYAASCLLFGPLSDVKGRRVILIAGMCAAALLNAVAAFSPSLPALLVVRVAQGLAAGTFGPVALGYIAESLQGPVERTGMAVLSTGLIATGAIAQIAAQALGTAFGWRSFFATECVLEVVAVVIMVRLLEEPNVDRSSRSLRSVYGAERLLLGKPAIGAAYFAGFLLFLSFVFYYSALGPHVARTFDSDGGKTIFVIRTVALPGMLLTLFAGPLMDRLSARFVLTAGLVVAAVGLVSSALETSNALALTIASATFSLGFAFGAVALNTLLAELGGTIRGAAIAFSVFLSFTGASVAPLLYTALAPIGFSATMLGLGFAAVVTAVLIVCAVRDEKPIILNRAA